MGKSEVETPLLPEDIESQVNEKILRLKEDYDALPGSLAAAAETKEVHLQESRWANVGVTIFVTLGCISVAVLLSAAFISPGPASQNAGEAIKDNDNADGQNEFYKASHTSYHFQPEKNWMNDPNAPMFYKGYYHFFYQYNPNGVVWGDIAWGHAVSVDLIHWMYLDLALVPDEWYDISGVWSGSATILLDGTPAILYTGARTAFGGDAEQSQNLAFPEDPSDPLLRKWKKVTDNPILVNPDNIRPQDFRDPTTAWLEKDGLWRVVVGAKKDNPDGSKDGISLLYKSSDFKHWEMEDKYLHEVAGTGMWECVDFYPVSVEGKAGLNHSILRAESYVDGYKYVLKASLDDSRHDRYAIGTYSTETHTFTPDDPSQDTGIGPSYDYGKFYASKTFYDASTGRRILWGWVNESDSVQDDITKGWASVQAIPRTVWLDGKTSKNLLQWPVQEVEGLRGAIATHENIKLQPADVVKVQGGDGPTLDIEVVFDKPDVSTMDAVTSDEEFDCSQGGSAHRGVFGPFGLLVLTDDAFTEQTAVFFYLSPSKDGQWATRVCSDQSRSSKALDIDKTVYGSYVTVLPTENTLSLRILVDHSIVETFVQGGRVAITSRVYPTVAFGSNSHLFLFNNGTTPIQVKSLNVYQMVDVKMFAI